MIGLANIEILNVWRFAMNPAIFSEIDTKILA